MAPQATVPEPVQAPLEPATTSTTDQELDRLKRRLAKVNALLEAQQAEIARLEAHSSEDEGLPSLTMPEAQVESLSTQRQALMTSIFEANQELQARLND